MKLFLLQYFFVVFTLCSSGINGTRQRVEDLMKTFSVTQSKTNNPTRILDSKKQHIPLEDPLLPDDVHQLFQYKDKETFKRKYVEWMYNAALQQ